MDLSISAIKMPLPFVSFIDYSFFQEFLHASSQVKFNRLTSLVLFLLGLEKAKIRYVYTDRERDAQDIYIYTYLSIKDLTEQIHAFIHCNCSNPVCCLSFFFPPSFVSFFVLFTFFYSLRKKEED